MVLPSPWRRGRAGKGQWAQQDQETLGSITKQIQSSLPFSFSEPLPHGPKLPSWKMTPTRSPKKMTRGREAGPKFCSVLMSFQVALLPGSPAASGILWATHLMERDGGHGFSNSEAWIKIYPPTPIPSHPGSRSRVLSAHRSPG